MRRSPSKASTAKRITRRSTAITRAVVRTFAPTGDAARWRISTSVPTVTQPGSRSPAMASADASSISMIIIGVPNTAGIVGMTCLTVRSGVTVRMRSALMPTLMMSRASMDDPITTSSRRTPGAIRRGVAFGQRGRCPLQQSTPGVMGPRLRGDDQWGGLALLALHRLALNKSLAALHLVSQRRFVDLDDDRIGVDAEVLHQRLRDVAHHAVLLFIGASGSHADGNFRHFILSLFSCYVTLATNTNLILRRRASCTDVIIRESG